ncbi:Peptidyl-prolyl cis-trans isomerase B [Verticillium dahliae VDG1]|nr:Peptidyl-prolyl cis-trans isomerase B [Verticillium dahliae VDG1]
MSNDNVDATRWSHSTGELEDKNKAEAGGGGSSHSSYSGVEEEGSVGVGGKAADLSLVISSGLEARYRRRKDPTSKDTNFDLDIEKDDAGKDATGSGDMKEGNSSKDIIADGVKEGRVKDEKKSGN